MSRNTLCDDDDDDDDDDDNGNDDDDDDDDDDGDNDDGDDESENTVFIASHVVWPTFAVFLLVQGTLIRALWLPGPGCSKDG